MAECKNCGWTYFGKYCPKCGTEYTEDTDVDDVSEVTLSSSISEADSEAEARRKLWDAMHKNIINETECLGCAKELEAYAPEDYYANFVESVFSGSQDEVCDFLRQSSDNDISMYADAVLDCICGHMTVELYAAVRSFKDRSNLRNSPEYEPEIEKFIPDSVRIKKERRRKKEERWVHRKREWVYPRAVFSILLTWSLLLVLFIALTAVFPAPARHWFIAGCILDMVVCVSLLVKLLYQDIWESYASVVQCILLAVGLIAALYGSADALIYGIMMMVALFINGVLYLLDEFNGRFAAVSYNAPAAVMFIIIAFLYFLDFGLVYADGYIADKVIEASHNRYRDYESYYAGEFHSFFVISWLVAILCGSIQMWCNYKNKDDVGFGMNMLPAMLFSFFVVLYGFMVAGYVGYACSNGKYPLGYWNNSERTGYIGYTFIIILGNVVDYIKLWFCREEEHVMRYFYTRIAFSLFELISLIIICEILC